MLSASQKRRINEDAILVDADQPAVYLAAIFWLGRRMVVAVDQAGECADDGGTEDILPMGWMTGYLTLTVY
jgi:hypothetical protein